MLQIKTDLYRYVHYTSNVAVCNYQELIGCDVSFMVVLIIERHGGLFYTLKYYQPYLEKLGEGSTNQTELRPSTVAELFIPIPPIGEQERIVTKLLEVLPMVDVYGEK